MKNLNQMRHNIFTAYCILMVMLLSACSGGTSLSNQPPLSNSKTITSYLLNGIPGTIDGESIEVIIPLNFNVESLVATFTTTGTEVTVNGVEQISGTTVNDFTNPVIYVVTAADGSMANYTVTVIIADEYAFNMAIKNVESLTSCSQILYDQLRRDLIADPQVVPLVGYYDIRHAIGSYNVVNYQDLGIFVLYPLGLSDVHEFGGWRDGDFITINSHIYSLYGITFSVPRTCIDQSEWGSCGVLELLIFDDSIDNGVCTISSSLIL